MKFYKGFNKDMTCQNFQYEEGKEFHTEKADCCHEGFHACEYPLDCLGYYRPNSSVFHEVELHGDMDRDGQDSKVCATDIKIGARLSIAGLVKAAIDFTLSKAKKEADANKDYGASSASDPTGVAVAWGHEAKAKGCIGARLVLADWQYVGHKYNDGTYQRPFDPLNWKLAGAKMVVVDGEKIKADIYYRCINGKIVEAKDE